MVGFEQAHATAAVDIGGAAPEHVFLLLELPPLLEALQRPPLPEADTRFAMGELLRLRASAEPASAPALADPLGESEQVMAEAARVIDAVTGALATAVLPDRIAGYP